MSRRPLPRGRLARTSLLGTALASLVALLGTIASADDTEVFFARALERGDHRASVLFMFDISGSMGHEDGTGQRRIDRLKLAMLDILETTDGVDVGIGAFNGNSRGGAILHPTVDPDSDVCADNGCDSIEVSARVREPSDDAEQASDGSVHIHSHDLDLTQSVAEGDVVWQSYKIDATSLAVQSGGGALDTEPDALPLFHEDGETIAGIGLRVEKVDVPQGATVLGAFVTFATRADHSRGKVSARISVDAFDPDGIDGSAKFADVAGEGVGDRARLAETLDWLELPRENDGDRSIATPNFAALLGARVAHPDWLAGDALALLFEPLPGTTSDAGNRRGFHSGISGAAPVLTIAYTESSENRRVGVRFAGLDVPRGARIRHATIEFVPDLATGSAANIVVRAEDSGDASTFSESADDIGGRTPGSASVTWRPGPWTSEREEERTGDLAPLVQEIVSRADWCGGNAIAFLLEGEGVRVARSRDAGRWDAPRLTVSYDPTSVDADSTCIERRTVASVRAGYDDGDQGDASAELNAASLETERAGAARTIGLRFRDIDVPNGATLAGARLTLASGGMTGGAAELAVRVQAIDNAPPFDASTSIGTRTAGESALLWTVPDAPAGESVSSIDLAALIEPVLGRAGWVRGGALVVTLTQSEGAARRFGAYEGTGLAPRLEILWRQESPGERIGPLRTAREALLDTVLGFRHRSGTPLVDAYHESALYMLGEPVDFGRTRGGGGVPERFFRLSAPSSYTGGSLFTPPSCDEVDPNAVACRGETLSGDARYIAPGGGACQANQIVLLSDGQATQGDSQERIRNLTGAQSCAARDNGVETCAFELAEWLHAGGEDREPIVTHTVGFNFTSDFLRDLADAGGGRFQEAGSAGELAGAFRTIIEKAASIDTSFVAPAATVSQFNRLANRDDVYYAMFRPSLDTRWEGNLKRYRIGTPAEGTDIALVDALGQPVLDEIGGGVRSTARSYWSDGVDGANVAAGGAANELALPRTLYTYTGAPDADTELEALSEENPNLDAALLDIAAGDAAYRRQLLQWARGVDVDDVDDDGDVTEVRHEMGDPMHSTPFVLNYAAEESTPARSLVFVGTNEGFLHAIDSDDGHEVFGFIPPDLLPNLDVFYRNESGRDRPYGLDGAITGWFEDTNANLVVDPGEEAYVVVGMRRGGRNYYALDVSDPDAPELAWVVRGGSGDFAELGQSWSRPVRARLPDSGSLREVLVFGGGYDPQADTRTLRDESGLADAVGRAVFVIDARSGEHLVTLGAPQFADMSHAIPSDINVLDIDLDGVADMFWVGDMGGRLWRFDIDDEAEGSMASAIGGAVVADFGGETAADNRRFHYPPDLALIRDDEGEIFLNVAIGSGWRARPLDSVVEDRFFVLRERALYGPPRDEDGAIDYPRVGESDLYDITDGSTRDDTSGRADSGWYLRLPGAGEKVLGSSLTVDRQILFSTYLPMEAGANSCGVSVGGGRFYALDAVYGDAALDLGTDEESTTGERSRPLLASGIPPPVSAFISASDIDSPLGMVGLERIDELDFGPSLRRTYWAEQ